MGWRSLLAGMLGTPDREAFAHLVMSALHDLDLDGAIEIGDEEFQLVLTDGDAAFDLEPVYQDYCQAPPWRRPGVLRGFAEVTHRGPQDLPDSWSVAAASVLPVIRDAQLYEALELEAQAEGTGSVDLPTRRLTRRLCIGLVYDWPDSMCSIDRTHLARWGVDFDQALEQALDNLDARSGGDLHEIADGLYLSPWQDTYDAARLLLPGVFQGLPLRGAPVAFLPNRGCLLITGSDDPDALAQAAEIAEEQLDAPRPISAIPLIGRHLQWAEFAVADDHPCAAILHRQRAQELTGCYQQQGALWQAVLAARQETGHLAQYQAMRDPDSGRIFSYCIWIRGMSTWLPETDEVILVEPPDANDECAVVARLLWADLADLLPALREPVGDGLPRYRVCDFPADESGLHRACLEIG